MVLAPLTGPSMPIRRKRYAWAKALCLWLNKPGAVYFDTPLLDERRPYGQPQLRPLLHERAQYSDGHNNP